MKQTNHYYSVDVFIDGKNYFRWFIMTDKSKSALTSFLKISFSDVSENVYFLIFPCTRKESFILSHNSIHSVRELTSRVIEILSSESE